MAIKTISIENNINSEILLKLKEDLNNFNPKMMIIFSSSENDNKELLKNLNDTYKECSIIGSTSHSEYYNNTFKNNTVSIMAIDEESVSDVCVKVIENVNDDIQIKPIIDEMENYFGGADDIFNNFDKYVGIVLFEKSSKIEEVIMDKLGVASDVLFIGGTSSDTGNNKSSVFANGKCYENAVVLAILKTVSGYEVLKTQSAEVFKEKNVVVTKSDFKNRIIYEFNNRPVAEVYAEILEVPVEKVADYFVSNPLGVIAGDEIFVRTFNEVLSDGSISVHCGIAEGAEIEILKIGDILKDTKKDLDSIIKEKPAGVINFNCIYRTFEIINEHKEKEYCELFGRYNNIGFSTNGEALLGHINETSTILVIK